VSASGNAISGIRVNRRVLDVISQNVANASNPDFSRQRAEVTSNNPLTIGTLTIGTGANVSEITRARDELLDVRFRQENQTFGRFDELNDVFSQIEGILNEPSEEGIRGLLSDFDSAMQSLASDPENRGARRDLVGQAQNFTSVVRRINRQLQQIGGEGGGGGQNSADAKIDATVEQINNTAEEIASLNVEISTTQAGGGNPNDLLDQRNALVEELSEVADIRAFRDNGEFRVNIGGFTLVQGNQTNGVSLERKNGENKLIFDDPNESVIDIGNGRLKALFEIKEDVVPKISDRLNDLAVQMVDRLNDQHKAGFGLDGQSRNNFFQTLPTREEGIFRLEGLGDLEGDISEKRAGFIDSPQTRLVGQRDGNNQPTGQAENFEADAGVFAIDVNDDPIGAPTGTLQINKQVINYDLREDSIQDVIDRINDADNQAAAYLSAENRLVIKGTQENNYEIDELRDTGLLLEKTNLVTVGGSDRTGKNDVDDATTTLIGAGNNFDGDTRLDGEVANPDSTSGRNLDLAEGTLEVSSSSPNPTGDFNVNYDAREDSLEEIVERINTKSNTAGSKVAAQITSDNRLRVFASDVTPAAAVDPDPGGGIEEDPEARFSINDRASQQIEADAGPDPFTTLQVNDTSGFQQGDVVTVSDDTGNTEKAVVRNVASPTQLDLHLNDTFNPADNPVVEGPNGSTQLNGGAGVQGGDGSTTVDVQDASRFSEGETVIFEDANNGPEKVVVKSIDKSNDTIEVNLDNTFEGGANGVSSNTGSVRRVDSNEKRNLLNVMGFDRVVNNDDESTEFAITGESGRPPRSEQVSSFRVAEEIVNNPDLVAAAAGDDTNLDGVAETSKGEGNGDNIQKMSELRTAPTMSEGSQSFDDSVSELVSEVGSDAQLVQREATASRSLVESLQDQIQSNSGVSLDEELTDMLRAQQAFQANARVLNVANQLSNSLLDII